MSTIHFNPQPIDQLSEANSATKTEWLWHGFVARGNITLLTSQWKAGKTTLLAGLLRAFGAGEPFLERPCQSAASVVVSEEATAHWAARHQAIPIGPRAQLVSRPFIGRPTAEHWDALIDQAETHRAAGSLDLFVVDPLATFLPGRSDCDPATLLDFLQPLRRLATAGVAVLVLHHPRKKPADEGSTARGSGVLLGFVDIIVELHRYGAMAADDHRRRLVTLSRHPESPKTLVYEWKPGTPDFCVIEDVNEVRFRENWETVRSILTGRTRPATHRELLADWPADKTPPSERQLYEWLNRAKKEDWVVRIGAGTRAEPYRFKIPGTDPFDRLGELPPLA